MDKTYYRVKMDYTRNGMWFLHIEFSDDPEGFFMPMVFEGDTQQEAKEKMLAFVGTESENLNKRYAEETN